MDELSINPRATLRTRQSETDYAQAKVDGKLRRLSEEKTLKDFGLWRIIDNRFPYDVAFQTHHLLLPVRVVANEGDLTFDEVVELADIKRWAQRNYDLLLENLSRGRSIKDHYHLHLLMYKDAREDMAL